MATITAGMPVLNAESSIAKAIEDLLVQTYRDFRLVVCDNASDDATVDIVAEYAKSDKRVELIRFEERVDIRLSFKRTFDSASSDYFMFTPADDRWYPEFMAKNLAVLENTPDLVASTGRVAFFRDGKFCHISNGTKTLAAGRSKNIVEYLTDPGENSRAFSLMRRAALEGAIPDVTFPGWDFQMIARTLGKGGYYELDEVLSERDVTPVDAYIDQAEQYYKNRLRELVPLHKFAVAVLHDGKIPSVSGKKRALIKLMVRSHMTYARYRMPGWSKVLLSWNNILKLDNLPVILAGKIN